MAETATPPPPADYEPRNILVTGGAGFIASHVVIKLARDFPQYNIVNFDKVDYCSCVKNLESVEALPNYKFVKGDILSADIVNYVLRENAIDTVMHFAAQTHVDNSFGNSFQFTSNNIMGTHVLLECAKNCGSITRFIHVSTDEVYGEGKDFDAKPMFEDEVLEPTNPYAATKAGAEFMAKSYHRSFNMPIIITRGNNVYGPHQYPEKLIPKFANQLMRGRAVTVHGDGRNTRNFLHVTDVADAFITILHKGSVGEVYNVGGNNERSVKEVAEELIAILCPGQDKETLISYVPDRFFNDLRYTINSDKLIELGWTENISWEEGIRETVNWYRNVANDGRYGNIDSALVAHPREGLGREAAAISR
uniref:NAD(P)-binding domain-containing protein n=1 Tax=Phaeomonas parva TaxID=124430 RepID=A0A7S1TSS4_9STRA|mmetsp:Transcript_16244/g.49632  ORF Transcript_16244/g.49632 Transcript_16244/m.49632 type:complete len:364 (+) Transcript_16244:73-1164(+)